MWNIRTNSWICATGDNTIAYSLGWGGCVYATTFIVLCANYSIYNVEPSLCVVNRRPLFYHVYSHFLICLCVLNKAGTYTPISTLALWGKVIGKWETGHLACSHKEKLNAVFPYLWTAFKLSQCRAEEQAAHTHP